MVSLPLRIAAGLMLLGLTLWLVGPDKVMAAVRRTDAWVFGGALLVAIGSNVASAARWSRIARALGLRAPLSPLIAMYARGITSNTILPGATVSGDMLRSYQLSRLGNPLLESTLSVAFDRFSGLWTLCVLSFLAALGAYVGGLGLDTTGAGRHGLATYGAVLGLIVALPFLPWPVERLAPIRRAGVQRLVDLWRRLHDPASGLKRRLASSIVLSLVVQVLSATALGLCGQALGVVVPWPLMMAAAAPIFVMAALPLGVAGFGTRELAAVGVLGLAGVDPDLAAGTGFLYGMLGVIQGVLAAPLFLHRARP